MKTHVTTILLFFSLSLTSQVDSIFREELLDENIEAIKVSMLELAISESDTASLNELLKRYTLSKESDESFLRKDRRTQEIIIGNNLSTLNSINYLDASESISFDSLIVRMERNSDFADLANIVTSDDLETIRNNSLLLSLDELGMRYNYITGSISKVNVWIEEIISYSSIRDGDKILMKGPSTSLGISAALLSRLYPNSEIVVVVPSERLQKQFKFHLSRFNTADSENLHVIKQPELLSLGIQEFDRIISMLNIESESELAKSLLVYRKLMNENSEFIYFDIAKQEKDCSACPGQIYLENLEAIFSKNKFIELEDVSFRDTKYRRLTEFTVKVFSI